MGLLGGPPGRVEDRRDPIAETGLVEKTGVELMLVDVEVTSKDGSPLPGLNKDDFRVELNDRDWPIYSVDDLCDCASPAGAGESGPATAAPDPEPPQVSEAEPLKFVLYLDYSQLRLDGRAHAVDEARRWIQETKQTQDEVMLVAHAEDAGLQVVADFTTDKAILLAALERSYDDPKLADPFPEALRSRIATCVGICESKPPRGVCEHCWKDAADRELLHAQHAFEALEYLLVRLQRVPGRKALVLFNQNGTLFPARYYPVDENEIGDQTALVDRVAAEATLARTRIYTAYAGDHKNGLATNLGANLAEFTGGGHNRALATLPELMSSAGRRCTCTYRIGVTPPEDDRVFRLTVEVRGRRLPHTHRVQHISDAERSMRMARATLLDPQGADDLPLVAAIVPVARSTDGWELELQVGVSADALLLLPSGEKRKKASWEVGALLSEQSARQSWEMVGVAELLRETDRPSAMTILHTRRMGGLRSGSYQLRAFVHDRITNLYGGALAAIELPAEADWIVGPFMRSTDGQFFRTTLPLRSKERNIEPVAVRAIEIGSLPIGDRSVRTGETIEFTSWICAPEARDTLLNARRFVTSEHRALFRFGAPSIALDGGCARLSDPLDTSVLAAGSYTYHVRLDRGPGVAAEDVEARFEIDASPATETLPAAAGAE